MDGEITREIIYISFTVKPLIPYLKMLTPYLTN